MFNRFFRAGKSRNRVNRTKKSERFQRLGFESLESRDLLATAPAILVDHLTGFTTENKGKDTFFLQLTQQPTKSVKLTITSSDTTQGKVTPKTLTFTPANWDQPAKHHFKVTGQANGQAIGAFPYELNGATTSKDAEFNNLSMPVISMTNFDQVPVKVTPILAAKQKGLLTTELGDAAKFTVELTHALSDGEIVVVPIHSSNVAQGTVDKSQLTFTADDFNIPQTVTITGQDDGLLHKKSVKKIDYLIVFDIVQSNDPDSPYEGINPADVKVSNTQRTDVARFNGQYAGDFTGSVSAFRRTFNLNGHLDATVSNGNVTLNELSINVPNVPGFGDIFISTSGTGTVTAAGKLSLTFANDGSPLSGRTVKNIPIVPDPNGLPLLKGTVSFKIDASDFGLGLLPVTVKLNIVRS